VDRSRGGEQTTQPGSGPEQRHSVGRRRVGEAAVVGCFWSVGFNNDIVKQVW
jgi:hypothetical protein